MNKTSNVNEQYEEWADDFDLRHQRDMQRALDREWKNVRAKRAVRHSKYVRTLRTNTNQNHK